MEEVRIKLRKRGFTSIQKMQFTNVLRNPVYIGQIKIPAWRDEPEEVVIGQHEPLISEELFRAVQSILDGRKRNFKPAKRNAELPLRGYLTCCRCGGKLTGSASRSRNGDKHYYYHCQKGCKERFRADKANQIFVDHLHSIEAPEEVVNLYYAIMQDKFKQDDMERETMISDLNKQIGNLQERIDKLVDKFADDLIDISTYNRTKKRYEDQLNNLIARLAEIERQDANFLRYVRFGFPLLQNLGGYYEEAELPVRQKIIGSIFPEKLVFEDEKYRTTQPNAVLELLSLKTNDLAQKENRLTREIANQSNEAPLLGLEPRTY
jgi:site-specific DNA recombinase